MKVQDRILRFLRCSDGSAAAVAAAADMTSGHSSVELWRLTRANKAHILYVEWRAGKRVGAVYRYGPAPEGHVPERVELRVEPVESNSKQIPRGSGIRVSSIWALAKGEFI